MYFFKTLSSQDFLNYHPQFHNFPEYKTERDFNLSR